MDRDFWDFDDEELDNLYEFEPEKVDLIRLLQWADEEGGVFGLLQRNGWESFPSFLRAEARQVEDTYDVLQARINGYKQKYKVSY